MATDVDGIATNDTFAASDEGTVELTTGAGVIILLVHIEDDTNVIAIDTVASPAGLTWHQRKLSQWVVNSVNKNTHELWWAYTPDPLVAEVITVTLDDVADAASIVAFGISEFGGTITSPFDQSTNNPLPAVLINTSSIIDTNNSKLINDYRGQDVFAFAIFATAYTDGVSTDSGAGWTEIADIDSDGATRHSKQVVSYQQFGPVTEDGIAIRHTGAATGRIFVADIVRNDPRFPVIAVQAMQISLTI